MTFVEWLNESDWENDVSTETPDRALHQLHTLHIQGIELLKRLQRICKPFTNSYSMIGGTNSVVQDSHTLRIPFYYTQSGTSLEPWTVLINCLAPFPTEDLRQIHRIASKLKDIYKEQKQVRLTYRRLKGL